MVTKKKKCAIGIKKLMEFSYLLILSFKALFQNLISNHRKLWDKQHKKRAKRFPSLITLIAKKSLVSLFYDS